MCFKHNIFSATRTQIYGLFRTLYILDDPRSPKPLDIRILCSSAAGALMSAAPESDRLRALNGIPARCDHVTSHLLPSVTSPSTWPADEFVECSFPGKCRMLRVAYNNARCRPTCHLEWDVKQWSRRRV